MVRKSNFIVEGQCFIPLQITSEPYDLVMQRLNSYLYLQGYNQSYSDIPLYKYNLLQQTFRRNILDEGSLWLKIKKALHLISKNQYDQEVYFGALNKLTDEAPLNISYSIVSARKKNVTGCIMKIRIEPAIIYKMKQVNPHLKVDKSEYEDIIDSNVDFISEIIAAFGFETIEKPCATNKYNPTKKESSGLITVSPSCFKIPEKNILPQAVSIMMPFKPEYDAVYKIIKDACSNIGLECHRADDFWNNSILIQDIFELIYCSSFVIVDLSGKNSNVFYEAGIAHTLGKEVISLTQDINDISFDLTHHRHIVYVNNEEGLEKLKMKLENRLQHLKDKQAIEI